MTDRLTILVALLTLFALTPEGVAAQPEVPACSRCNLTSGSSGITEGLFYAFEEIDPLVETVIDAGADSPELLWTLAADPQAPQTTGLILDADGNVACELAGGTLFDARGGAVLELVDGSIFEPQGRSPLLTFAGYQAIEGDPATGQVAWESTRHADDTTDLVRAATGALHLGACGAAAQPPDHFECTDFGPNNSLCAGDGPTFETRDLVLTDCMTSWPGEPLACETSATLSPGLPPEWWDGGSRAVVACATGTALTCEHVDGELRCWCAAGAGDGGTFKIKKQSDGTEG